MPAGTTNVYVPAVVYACCPCAATATLLRNDRPNPLAEPPPNAAKNGVIVYANFVCDANILNAAFAVLISV